MANQSAQNKSNMTEKQERWFASVKEGLERETGKSFARWVKIARTCPETKPRARQKWFKETHGLGVNRASVILMEAFGGLDWDKPDQLQQALWKDTEARVIFDKIRIQIEKINDATLTQRKGYTAWSRKVQFAAAKPTKDTVRLGLAVTPDTNKRLEEPKKSEGWSERLKSVIVLTKPSDVNAVLTKLLKASWDLS